MAVYHHDNSTGTYRAKMHICAIARTAARTTCDRQINVDFDLERRGELV